MKKVKKKPKKKKRKFIKTFIIIVLFFYVGTLIKGTLKFYFIEKQSYKDIEKLQAEIEEYDNKIDTMETELKNVSEDEKIERVARNKLNMKKSDEKVYKVIE